MRKIAIQNSRSAKTMINQPSAQFGQSPADTLWKNVLMAFDLRHHKKKELAEVWSTFQGHR